MRLMMMETKKRKQRHRRTNLVCPGVRIRKKTSQSATAKASPVIRTAVASPRTKTVVEKTRRRRRTRRIRGKRKTEVAAPPPHLHHLPAVMRTDAFLEFLTSLISSPTIECNDIRECLYVCLSK